MFNKSVKPIYFLVFVITLLVFVVQIIIEYIFILTNFSFIYRIFVYLISSIFLGASISSGIYLLIPTLSESMITLRRMLRAESLSNPLLLKLSTKAPGTYHHSLNVSTLAQKAAKSIGANSFLVRIAAYYHDIGKIGNPSQYSENQSDQDCPDLSNTDAQFFEENAKRIISHVENGISIAKKNNLPNEIIDLIGEHHGTTHVSYFFDVAKKKGYDVRQQDFRYPGPTPQSKESAVLMLSDCVEATARSSPDLTNKKIKDIVLNTVKNRVEEGQIKGSGLNDSDLSKIERSLIDTLCSIYHQRINYEDRNHK